MIIFVDFHLSSLATERTLIIGGHAVRFHGVNREVEDLDVAVDSADRSEDMASVILEVSGRSFLDNFCLGKPDNHIMLKNERQWSDILTSKKGVEFAEAYGTAHVVEVEGVTVRVISKEHLIRNKRIVGREAGREKDLQDVERLEALA